MKLKCILKEEVDFIISNFFVDANGNKADNGGADDLMLIGRNSMIGHLVTFPFAL